MTAFDASRCMIVKLLLHLCRVYVLVIISLIFCVQKTDKETEAEDDEAYTATVPVPPSTATWLEFKEYEVSV